MPQIVGFGGSFTYSYNENNFVCFFLRHGVCTCASHWFSKSWADGRCLRVIHD